MNELDIRTARRLVDIKAALSLRAMTATELGAAIHINTASAQQYMRDLRGTRVFIEAWRRSPSHIVPAYRWGVGVNAERPRGKTAAESERERLARIRKDPDAYARHLAKERARYAQRKAVKVPNHWFAALPGAQAIKEARP